MKPANLRRWRLVHRWTSLICSVNLLILCVTGLILVFHHEIEHLMGDEFDRQYRDDQRAAHRNAIALFQRYAEGGDNPTIRIWARNMLPVLKEHLEMVEALGR